MAAIVVNNPRQPTCGEVVKKKCVTAIKVINKISQGASDLLKMNRFVAKIIELSKAIFQGLSESTQALYGALKTSTDFIINVGIFTLPFSWYEAATKKVQTWQQTAELACDSASSVLGLTGYISNFYQFNLKAAMGAIGVFPVLGLIDDGLSLLSNGFGLWNNTCKVKNQNSKMHRLDLKAKVMELAGKDQLNLKQVTLLSKAYRASLAGKSKKFITKKMEKFADFYFKAKVNQAEKVKDLKEKRIKVEFERNKSALQLVYNILRLIGVTLSIVGLATGAALLSPLGIPLITLGVIAAGISFGKAIYSHTH